MQPDMILQVGKENQLKVHARRYGNGYALPGDQTRTCYANTEQPSTFNLQPSDLCTGGMESSSIIDCALMEVRLCRN